MISGTKIYFASSAHQRRKPIMIEPVCRLSNQALDFNVPIMASKKNCQTVTFWHVEMKVFYCAKESFFSVMRREEDEKNFRCDTLLSHYSQTLDINSRNETLLCIMHEMHARRGGRPVKKMSHWRFKNTTHTWHTSPVMELIQFFLRALIWIWASL